MDIIIFVISGEHFIIPQQRREEVFCLCNSSLLLFSSSMCKALKAVFKALAMVFAGADTRLAWERKRFCLFAFLPLRNSSKSFAQAFPFSRFSSVLRVSFSQYFYRASPDWRGVRGDSFNFHYSGGICDKFHLAYVGNIIYGQNAFSSGMPLL